MIPYKPVLGTFDLSQKVAIVTGGAGSIGLETAKMYARKGANIALIDVKDNVADAAASLEAEFGIKAIGLKADLRVQEDVDNAVAQTLKAFGKINILANVAGRVDLDSAESIDFKLVEDQMDVNCLGAFRLTQKVGQVMIKQGTGGKIVCVTSQADFIAIDKHIGYTMSKAAMVGMIKVLALEWAKYGINVNGVAPTVVRTELGDRAWQGEARTNMIEAIPAHRFAESDEIAAAVLFLSCDEANMITGEDLVIDGGFTIH